MSCINVYEYAEDAWDDVDSEYSAEQGDGVYLVHETETCTTFVPSTKYVDEESGEIYPINGARRHIGTMGLRFTNFTYDDFVDIMFYILDSLNVHHIGNEHGFLYSEGTIMVNYDEDEPHEYAEDKIELVEGDFTMVFADDFETSYIRMSYRDNSDYGWGEAKIPESMFYAKALLMGYTTQVYCTAHFNYLPR